MKKVTLSLILFILFLSISSIVVKAQNYKLIDLKDSSVETANVNYYILEVIDSREVNAMIGMEKSEGNQEIALINFSLGFHDELYEYFKTSFPAKSGGSPVILNFKKLWVNEIEKDGTTLYKCEIELEFFTPKKQLFYQCTQNNESEGSSNMDTHKKNVVITLNKCMQSLGDSSIQQKYFSALNSETYVTLKQENVEGNQEQVNIRNEASQATLNTDASDHSKSRIAINAGYTYRLAKVPDGVNGDYEDHLKRLKNGFHLGADMHFYTSHKNAFGGTFSYTKANSSLPDVSMTDELGNILAIGDMTEDIGLLYIGPSYMLRISSKDGKVQSIFSLTLGYYSYNEKLSWLGESVDINGSTLGFGVSYGSDFITSDKFALGFHISVTMGAIQTFYIEGEELKLDESENISRIDIGVGIRFLK